MVATLFAHSNASSRQGVDVAVRSVLSHSLTNLLHLSVREAAAYNLKLREAGLPGEDGKQWCNALITVREPVVFTPDGELL